MRGCMFLCSHTCLRKYVDRYIYLHTMNVLHLRAVCVGKPAEQHPDHRQGQVFLPVLPEPIRAGGDRDLN